MNRTPWPEPLIGCWPAWLKKYLPPSPTCFPGRRSWATRCVRRSRVCPSRNNVLLTEKGLCGCWYWEAVWGRALSTSCCLSLWHDCLKPSAPKSVIKPVKATEKVRPRSEEHTSELQSRGHLV